MGLKGRSPEEQVAILVYLAGIVAFVAYIIQLGSHGVMVGITDVPADSVFYLIVGMFVLLVWTRGGVGLSCLALYGTLLFRGAEFGSLPSLITIGLYLVALVVWWVPIGPDVYNMLFADNRLTAPIGQSGVQDPKVVNQTTHFPTKAVLHAAAFDNLIGVDRAIQEFKDALELPIVHPELMKEYSIEPMRGIILYGPPGTGKTSLARAVAEYFNVPFICQKASACSGRYVGTSESNVRALFDRARSLAAEKHSRVIIFLDEIDAIAQKRDGGHLNRPSDLILNPLLEELDGFKKDSAIFMIAATNRIDVLDEAILRPGRLDKRIEVGYPDEEARGKLFRLYLKSVPLCKNDEIVARFNEVVAECARKWDRISPADIKEICQRVKVKAATRQASTKEVGIRAEDLRKEVEAWSPVLSG